MPISLLNWTRNTLRSVGQLRNLHLQGSTPEMCRILEDERLAETSGYSREKGNAGNHIEFIRSIYHQRCIQGSVGPLLSELGARPRV